jgi:hypothetical protein
MALIEMNTTEEAIAALMVRQVDSILLLLISDTFRLEYTQLPIG